MKNLFLLIALFFTTYSFSQSINGFPVSEIDLEYIQIVGTGRFLSDKVNVEIDFGQNTKYFSLTNKETKVKDENNKRIKFNSMIDALNFMTANGYHFVDSYGLSAGNQSIYHYLMKKNDE